MQGQKGLFHLFQQSSSFITSECFELEMAT